MNSFNKKIPLILTFSIFFTGGIFTFKSFGENINSILFDQSFYQTSDPGKIQQEHISNPIKNQVNQQLEVKPNIEPTIKPQVKEPKALEKKDNNLEKESNGKTWQNSDISYLFDQSLYHDTIIYNDENKDLVIFNEELYKENIISDNETFFDDNLFDFDNNIIANWKKESKEESKSNTKKEDFKDKDKKEKISNENSTLSKKEKEEIDQFVENAILNAKKEYELQKKAANENKSKGIKEVSKKDLVDKKDLSDLVNFAINLEGVPYVYGGTSTKGFDCSGFVQYVFNNFNVKIPRTTYSQIKKGTSVNLNNIKANDLIFFDTVTGIEKIRENINKDIDTVISETAENSKYQIGKVPSHVGLYIGNNMFIHASSYKKKIAIEQMDNPYFKERIIDVRRYM